MQVDRNKLIRFNPNTASDWYRVLIQLITLGNKPNGDENLRQNWMDTFELSGNKPNVSFTQDITLQK